MEVTEHNISDTDLNLEDIDLLIRLVKKESEEHGDRSILLYYGNLIGKLVCLRHNLIS
jgi:hypothetical protein